MRFQVIISQPNCTYNTSAAKLEGYDMIDYKQIGVKIRKARLEKKITQEQLAALADVGVTHISHIETGNTIPSLKTLIAIVNALDCSMDELFSLEVRSAKPVALGQLSALLDDCTEEEMKIITDTVSALCESLRRNRREM